MPRQPRDLTWLGFSIRKDAFEGSSRPRGLFFFQGFEWIVLQEVGLFAKEFAGWLRDQQTHGQIRLDTFNIFHRVPDSTYSIIYPKPYSNDYGSYTTAWKCYDQVVFWASG